MAENGLSLKLGRVPGALRARLRRLWFRLRDERATSVRHRWLSPPPDCNGREVCAFVTYAPGGLVPAHALDHARAWRAQGFAVVLIICLDDLDTFPADQPLENLDAVMLRANRGYDFGAWATAIHALPNLVNAARLVTVNDSVFGPFNGFDAFVARLRASSADFVGTVESREHRSHFQSFLLSFGPGALASEGFWQFWRELRVGGRQEVIETGELSLLGRMIAGGLSVEALYPFVDDGTANPTLQRWRALIEAGFPYAKVQLLRDNPFAADLTGWRALLSSRGYDPAIVDRHLGRNQSDQ